MKSDIDPARARELFRNAPAMQEVATDLAEAADWPTPEPLPAVLYPVPKMIPEMLPAGLRPWISDISERMSCPIEFPAVASMGALSSAIGRRVRIQPKRADDWTVVPNLWGAVVGPPSVLKSPANGEALQPLRVLEDEAANANEEAARDFEYQKVVKKVRREETERNIRMAIKAGEPIPERAASDDEETKPSERRFIVNDSTVEKLGVILNENPHGVLLFRDELTGWLRTLDRDGHEGDRGFYLEAWVGSEPYTYDRIGRGTIRIKSTCVSVFGSIQPGPLGQYLRDAVRGGAGDDGFIPRFQLLVFPDVATFTNVDRKPDAAARVRAERLFRSLAVDRDEPVILRFHAPHAQAFFDRWREDLEARIRRDDEHPAVVAHLAKYRSLMPSLALIFHLANAGEISESPVTLEAAELAAVWCDFLEAHARRVYSSVVHANRHAAHLLAGKLKKDDRNGLPDPFTARDIYRKSWSGLTDKEEVWGALDLLEECGWVRCERIESTDVGGKPTRVYHVNPRIRATT